MELIGRIIEPVNITGKTDRFTDLSLKRMIVPLFVEQLLQVAVGLVDTLMVSYAGEAVVSGISLIGLVSMVYLGIFNALAVGGAVIVSQYIGNGDRKKADHSASQTMLLAVIFSLTLFALLYAFRCRLLGFLYGAVEPDVMDAAEIYFSIMLLSMPAVAVYNAGCAVYRSMGRTRPTMVVSIIMNTVNAAGNAVGIFVLNAGAKGVAWPSVFSWYLAAVIMTVMTMQKKNPVHISFGGIFSISGNMMKRILHVAVPNMIAGMLFSGTKVVLGSVVSGFGTVQITANGISQTIWNLSALMCSAMGTVCTTVIGQCMGARQTDEAAYYVRKLIRLAVLLSFVWNGMILCSLPLLLKLYQISDEARRYVMILVIIHNSFSAFVQPVDTVYSCSIRAAGDVKFDMYMGILCTVVWRLLVTWFLGIILRLGVIATAIAMVSDWALRSILCYFRFRTGKWREFRLI